MRKSLLFVILLITAITLSFTLYLHAQQPRFPLATLDEIKGEVEIKSVDGQWQRAKRGFVFAKRDIIRTERNSKTAIKIINEEEVVKINIDQETETSINELLINRFTGKQDSSIGLKKGHVGLTARKFDRGTIFTTETPNAIVELGKFGFIVKYKEEIHE